MKKFLPVLFGILLPLMFFLYVLSQDPGVIENPLAKTLGINVGFGDPNVENLSYDEFYSKQIEKALQDRKGTFSVYIKDLEANKFANVGPKYTFYAASLFKIPVAIETLKLVEKEELALSDELIYTQEHYYGGSGKIKTQTQGTSYNVDQLLSYLIKDSDNIAQSLLLTKVNKDNVYNLMPSPTTLKSSNVVALLEELYNGSHLSQENTEKLLSLMSKTSFDNRVNAGLVKGLSFSHKIGNWGNTGSWHDCGILKGNKTLIVCVMSKGTTFEDFLLVSEEIGRISSKLAQ